MTVPKLHGEMGGGGLLGDFPPVLMSVMIYSAV